jgi:hypothetical protein
LGSKSMRFFKLEIKRTRPFVECSSANDWEAVRCSRNPGHQRAGRRVTDLMLDVVSKNMVDFSRTMLSDVVITDRARKVLQDANLTGFAVAPTRVTTLPAGVDGSTLPALWEFVVVGQAGTAHEDSGIVTLRRCDECGLVEYSDFRDGIVVNTAKYDGSDFFVVQEYPKYILVSERSKSVIEAGRLTNACFVESTEIRWPEGVAKPA